MTVAVIIATYNGGEKLPMILAALKEQSFKNFSVLIAIDGSTDNSHEVATTNSVGLRDVKIITQANKGRASIKNFAASRSNAELLIFYDDDMKPLGDSVERHVRFHETHNGILSGRTIDQSSGKQSDISQYKSLLSAKWTAKYDEGLNSLTINNLFFTAANSSIRKGIFTVLNGFNESLTDAEDYDLALRALSQDIPVYFDKSNIALHLESITCRTYVQRLREYNVAHQKLIKLGRKAKTENNTKTWKKIVYYLFASSAWVWMIDNTSAFKVVPKKLRYLVYSLVLQALSKEFPNVKL
jgi:glycosyltransferase involved in cell wall biosynthesis